MNIAIVGSGVSGLTCALLLSREHQVTVFESEDYIGGHTHTIPLPEEGVAVDTGFIVFNHENYPGFVKLLERLEVTAVPSKMSFSVVNERNGLEYGFSTLNAIFAQRRNLFRPGFWRMLNDIKRFRHDFVRLKDAATDEQSLEAYLTDEQYSRQFVDDFLVPFGAAIWSAAPDRFGQFPLKTFVQFFMNHGFLDPDRLLQWFVVDGGSSTYVQALLKQFRGTINTRSPVLGIKRDAEGVWLTASGSEAQRFDQVILASHSDQALAMLEDPTPQEREILGAMPYQPNDVVLHDDIRQLPQRRHVWASWNYRVPPEPSERVTVTYDMNILQGLQTETEYLVTLNPVSEIEESRVRGRYLYHHPIYETGSVAAQKRHGDISGQAHRTHYAGAYWGYGFHEDGVQSALRVCRAFGEEL